MSMIEDAKRKAARQAVDDYLKVSFVDGNFLNSENFFVCSLTDCNFTVCQLNHVKCSEFIFHLNAFCGLCDPYAIRLMNPSKPVESTVWIY